MLVLKNIVEYGLGELIIGFVIVFFDGDDSVCDDE